METMVIAFWVVLDMFLIWDFSRSLMKQRSYMPAKAPARSR